MALQTAKRARCEHTDQAALRQVGGLQDGPEETPPERNTFDTPPHSITSPTFSAPHNSPFETNRLGAPHWTFLHPSPETVEPEWA